MSSNQAAAKDKVVTLTDHITDSSRETVECSELPMKCISTRHNHLYDKTQIEILSENSKKEMTIKLLSFEYTWGRFDTGLIFTDTLQSISSSLKKYKQTDTEVQFTDMRKNISVAVA